MLRGKLHGAWLLHELTRTLPLDFFVLYSAAGGGAWARPGKACIPPPMPSWTLWRCSGAGSGCMP